IATISGRGDHRRRNSQIATHDAFTHRRSEHLRTISRRQDRRSSSDHRCITGGCVLRDADRAPTPPVGSPPPGCGSGYLRGRLGQRDSADLQPRAPDAAGNCGHGHHHPAVPHYVRLDLPDHVPRRAGRFRWSLTRSSALYFTVTVFSTVGFGDITAKTDVARLVVTVQMLADLAVVAVVIRLMLGAASRGVDRQKELTE